VLPGPHTLAPSNNNAGADKAQEKSIADTKRPIPIPTEQEAVVTEAFPNPSAVRGLACGVPLAVQLLHTACYSQCRCWRWSHCKLWRRPAWPLCTPQAANPRPPVLEAAEGDEHLVIEGMTRVCACERAPPCALARQLGDGGTRDTWWRACPARDDAA
jgi:hypothetical protein